MKIIGFCGRKRSGKDTCAKYLATEHNYIHLAFADGVRDFVKIVDPFIPYGKHYVRLSKLLDSYDWEDLKKIEYVNEEVRRLLQVVGTEVGRDLVGENIWVEQMERKIASWGNIPRGFVISDVRFPNEAEWIRSKGGVIVKMHRKGVDTKDKHRSETEVDKVKADYHITNDGDTKELYENIDFILGDKI